MNNTASLRGLILSGGMSRRMGRDKAKIHFAGKTLLERAVQLLRLHIEHVHVSVRSDQQQDAERQPYPLIIDDLTGIGPAAGILAAHSAWPDAAWLVVACDMPYLGEHEIAALIAGREAGKPATAWLADVEDGPEPLCAIYEPGNLAAFATHVAAGGNPSPKAWLSNNDTHYLVAQSKRALMSVNTSADVDSLKS